MGRIVKYLAILVALGLVAFLIYAAVADLSVTRREMTVDVPLPADR